MDYDMMDKILFAEPDKIRKVLSGEEELNDELEIEDALLEINRLQRDVEFFKRLKQRRVEPLDRRIKEASSQIDTLKVAIINCMQDNKQTKLDFPDVAKLSKRKKSGSWEVVDQEALDNHLDSLNVINDVAQRLWKYDKRKLNKLLDELMDNNNISDDTAKKGEDGTSLVISFQDKAESRSKDAEAKRDEERWQKANQSQKQSSDSTEYDTIEV